LQSAFRAKGVSGVKGVESGVGMGQIVGGLREGFNWLQQDVAMASASRVRRPGGGELLGG